MKYQIINENTGLTEQEFYDIDEAYEVFNESYQYGHYVRRVIPCRGCEDGEGEEQHDAHFISTGYWCNDCYESDRYPYRRDKYPTVETHGYGERLSDDY
jgi:hypothetical protein